MLQVFNSISSWTAFVERCIHNVWVVAAPYVRHRGRVKDLNRTRRSSLGGDCKSFVDQLDFNDTEWMKESIKNHQRILERRVSAQSRVWLQLLCSLQHPWRCQRRVMMALRRWERNKTKSKSLHQLSQRTRSLRQLNHLRNLIPAIQSARQPTRTWRKPLKLWVKRTHPRLYTILMLRNQDTDISNW